MRDKPNTNLYHFQLAFVGFILMFALISTAQPNHQQLTEQMMIHRHQYRLLEQQKNTTASEQSQPLNLNKNTFLMVVVIGSVVFLVVGLICCVICIVRCIIKIERGRGGGFKVTNARINYAILCPKIQYSLFLEFVGQPYQDHCVICLEEFSPAPPNNSHQLQHDLYNFPEEIVYPISDQIKIEEQPPVKKQQLRQSKQTEYVENDEEERKEENTVKLTLCGHLLHAKCLDSWLEKQQNCPLCREEFTIPILEDWSKKLGIDILKFDASLQSSENNSSYYSNVNEGSKKSRQPNIHETLNSINKSLEQNICQTRKEIEERRMKLLTQVTKRILIMYCKIMAYHKKQTPDLHKIEHLQCHSNKERELYFEENELENSPKRRHTCDREISNQERVIKLKRRRKLKQQSQTAINS